MRQRPKPANYLNRFGQKLELETKTSEEKRRLLTSKAKKKEEQKVVPSRGKTNLIERRHITPDAENYGWVEQDAELNEGSKVSQFRSLDDIPDGLPVSVIKSPNKYSSDIQPPTKPKVCLDDINDENFWAQPSPKAKQIKSEFIAQQMSPRVTVHGSTGDDWGAPVNTSPRFEAQYNISALTSLDDFLEDDNSPRYEDVRREHVPSGHMKMIGNREEPVALGGRIAKKSGMQRMRTLENNTPAASLHEHVDHGFSPPRGRQQVSSGNDNREYQRGFSPVQVPPLPVQKAKKLPEFPGLMAGAPEDQEIRKKFGKMRRGGFDGDIDDYEEIDQGFSRSPRQPKSDRGTPRSPRQYGFSVDNNDEYDEDSENDQISPHINAHSSPDPASGALRSGGGGGYSKEHAPGPYNKKNLNLGLSSPPKMIKNAPPLPVERPKDVPDDQKLYYSKQPRHVDYKPYTLKDYKASKPKEYQEIPRRLKPDLNTDTLKAKRANKERVKEFSKHLFEYNKNEIQAHKKLPNSIESRDLELSTAKRQSKTEKMKEYGKRIPKPKASDNSTISTKPTVESSSGNPPQGKGVFRSKLDSIYDDEDWNAKDDMIDDSELYLAAPDPSGMEMATANKIDELEAKRDDSRRQIEAIKRSLKL